MVTATPRPGPESVQPSYDIHARITHTLRALALRTNQLEIELFSSKHEYEQLKCQNKQLTNDLADLRRVVERRLTPHLGTTSYMYALQLSDHPMPTEQMAPADPSLEDTQILPNATSAGDEDYTTSVTQADMPIVTSYLLGKEVVKSFEQALTKHQEVGGKAANIIYTNGLGRLMLYLHGVRHVDGIEWRCHHMLADEEILCVTMEGIHETL